MEDYSWFPESLRLQQMEFIGWVTSGMGALDGAIKSYKSWAPEGSIMDLCSGSGQPAVFLHQHADLNNQLELTDLHPSFLKTFSDQSAAANVVLRHEPLDVLEDKGSWITEAEGFSMYNAFHHFKPQQQIQMVRQMAKAHKPFFFVEILQPNIWSFLQILLTTTLGQLILGPFIRPFRWSRIFWTYVLPINLLTITFDGLVSVFRAQSQNTYEQLLSPLNTHGYKIKVYNKRSAWGTRITIIEGAVLTD